MRGLKPCGGLRGEAANGNQSVDSNRPQYSISYYLLEERRSLCERVSNDSWSSRRFAREGWGLCGGLGDFGFCLGLSYRIALSVVVPIAPHENIAHV